MGEAYTPGLRVSEQMVIRKERRLPLKGKVLVNAGARVSPDAAVAQTELPGNVEIVNVANALGLDPKAAQSTLLKKEGDAIGRGELLARASGLFGLFSSECRSPVAGTLEVYSPATGKATLRSSPIPVTVKAFIEGEVTSVIPDEGVVISSRGTYVQGIFGIGGETWGPIAIASSSRDEVLDENRIDEKCAGCIVVGGRYVTATALRKAKTLGAKGIIVGGMDDADLRAFLGYDLGVAITGRENVGLTVILTEGFGEISMAQGTFDILKACQGRLASIDGRTQIRAGVIRPEIIVAKDVDAGDASRREVSPTTGGLSVGSKVRIIRDPYFGNLATVTALPPEPRKIETEAETRVVEVKLDSGQSWILPRANIELIET